MPMWPTIAGMYASGRLVQPDWNADWRQPPAAAPDLDLRISDMYTPIAEPEMPAPPQYARDISQLDPAMQRRIRQDTILQALSIGAQGMDSGHLGSALLAGAVAGRERQSQEVDAENQRRRQQYLADRQLAQERADRENKLHANRDNERKAAARLGIYQAIVKGTGGKDPRLAQSAQFLAQSGDDAGLQQAFASMPGRQALIRAGVNPDDPMAVKLYEDKQTFPQELEQAGAKEELAAQIRNRNREPEVGALAYGPDGAAVRIVGGKAVPVMGADGKPFIGARLPSAGDQGGDPIWEKAIEMAGHRISAAGELGAKMDLNAEASKIYDAMKRGPALAAAPVSALQRGAFAGAIPGSPGPVGGSQQAQSPLDVAVAKAIAEIPALAHAPAAVRQAAAEDLRRRMIAMQYARPGGGL